MNKKIAVCMATYNGEKYIAEQLKSILSELSLDDIVVISDDHSTDRTIEIIKGFNDKRVHVYSNEGKAGSSYNFQNALKHAKADVYFLADQDDVWLKGRVKKTLNCLEMCDFCVCDAKIVDGNLDIINESRFQLYGIKQGFLHNFIKTRYIGCCMAFTSNVYERLFPFPKNVRVCPHDFWVALIGEAFFKSRLINEPLMLYRRHGGNVSDGGENSQRTFGVKVVSRFYCGLWMISRRLSTIKKYSLDIK